MFFFFYVRKGANSISGEKSALEKLPTKLLITQPLQPSNEANYDVKNRLRRAKSDANNLRYFQQSQKKKKKKKKKKMFH